MDIKCRVRRSQLAIPFTTKLKLLPMIEEVKNSLWSQFGASIDMLKNAIALWPEVYWHTDRKFFYNA